MLQGYSTGLGYLGVGLGMGGLIFGEMPQSVAATVAAYCLGRVVDITYQSQPNNCPDLMTNPVDSYFVHSNRKESPPAELKLA